MLALILSVIAGVALIGAIIAGVVLLARSAKEK
jgi:hypothetical protein